MTYLSDLLLTAAALGAAIYCAILSRRLKALGTLEGGVGSAIAVLSAQVDALARSLTVAQATAGRVGGRLDGQVDRAETVARKLELLVASMHDLPEDRGTHTTARPPSPWPTDAAPRQTAPEPQDDDHGAAPTRARVLRRRQGPGAF